MAKKAENIEVHTGTECASVALSPTQVAIVFDASEKGKPSSAGKTMLVASSRGSQTLADTGLTYSLNVMKKLTFTPEEVAQMLANRE